MFAFYERLTESGLQSACSDGTVNRDSYFLSFNCFPHGDKFITLHFLSLSRTHTVKQMRI